MDIALVAIAPRYMSVPFHILLIAHLRKLHHLTLLIPMGMGIIEIGYSCTSHAYNLAFVSLPHQSSDTYAESQKGQNVRDDVQNSERVGIWAARVLGLTSREMHERNDAMKFYM
jgi:hypothetical protein